MADQRADTSPLPLAAQRSPRTAAGRDLLRNLQKVQPEADSWIWWAEQGILAIEAEAAADSLRSVGPAAAEPQTWERLAELESLVREGVKISPFYDAHFRWRDKARSALERAAQPPRGSQPDFYAVAKELHEMGGEFCHPFTEDHPAAMHNSQAAAILTIFQGAGGSLTATARPAVTALRELMEAMEACRVAGDESVKRAGSAKDAFGQSEDIMGPALDRLAAAEEQARSIIQESGPPRGVTVAADRPALDVERLRLALKTLHHDAGSLAYQLGKPSGHGDQCNSTNCFVEDALARLGSEPTALPKSPEDSDG